MDRSIIEETKREMLKQVSLNEGVQDLNWHVYKRDDGKTVIKLQRDGATLNTRVLEQLNG